MHPNTLTYENLERRISSWAATQPAVRAILAIGSRARGTPDRWSDLDVLIFTTDAPAYAADSAWLAQFGDLQVTYMEPTGLGDPEWYALYAGGLKLDAVLMQVADASLALETMLEPFAHWDALRRGVTILYDRLGTARALPPQPFTPPDPPTAAEFHNTVSGFLLASATIAKFVARGDYWRAQRWFANDLHVHLLKMTEWHAHGSDTWYAGRFMQQWADPRILAALPQVFASFEREDLQRALLAGLDLMRWLGEETAAKFGYTYPAETHEQVAQLVSQQGE